MIQRWTGHSMCHGVQTDSLEERVCLVYRRAVSAICSFELELSSSERTRVNVTQPVPGVTEGHHLKRVLASVNACRKDQAHKRL